MLTHRYDEALDLAHAWHRDQKRKGTGIPYVAHLLAVSALVLEHEGTEEEAIAGLLHDALEDAPDQEEADRRRCEIRRRFGESVLSIVEACTDAEPSAKALERSLEPGAKRAAYQDRKSRYIEHLPAADRSARLVAAADKVHNAGAIVRDLHAIGLAVFERFMAKRELTLWYLLPRGAGVSRDARRRRAADRAAGAGAGALGQGDGRGVGGSCCRRVGSAALACESPGHAALSVRVHPVPPGEPRPVSDRPARRRDGAASSPESHAWEFKRRFRRHAFGWKSQPAIQRVKEAVSEIRKAARHDPLLGAEGAVLFLERVSPALEQVDSSSGAIGTAVNRAVDELVAIIVAAPADTATREAWLDRLWEAHASDEIPYIERLADHWGELCASKEVASAWADRLLDITRLALNPDRNVRGFFHGTTACLTALYRAERHDEILDVLKAETFWPYKRWAVKALAATGRKAEAIRLAEASRGPWTNDHDVDALCEEILLSSGLADEAYARYGLRANRAGTYVATLRSVAKKYPHKPAEEILRDLVKASPGEEGKWFAAAKELGLYDLAIDLARTSPCDPKTLARAARDHVATHPGFAIEAGLAALAWIVEGFGYEITSADARMAYRAAAEAAEALGRGEETKARVRGLTDGGLNSRFVAEVLRGELGPGP